MTRGRPISLTELHPHSEESERAVLAGALLDPNTLPLVAGHLKAEDFYLERHRHIYEAMLLLLKREVAVDIRTLQDELKQMGVFDTVGGVAYLAGLDLDLPDLGRIENYADIVKERAVRRRLIKVSQQVISEAVDGGLRAPEVIANLSRQVESLGSATQSEGLQPISLVYDETLVTLRDRADNRGHMIGLPTGFLDWDKKTQGLVDGNLIIIAGRPGMGKTSFAINVAQHVAIREGLPVGIFSLEMGRSELALRILSSEAGLFGQRLRAADLSENEWARVYDAVRATGDAPIYIDEASNPSLLEISARAKRMQADHGLSLLIVDYLQLMSGGGGRYENRNIEIGALSRGFKQLAKDLDIPVILLSQLSRGPERRTRDHRPVLADLRESGSIEQDADLVCFVFREEVYNKEDPELRGLAELIMAKHRNGEVGTVNLGFDGGTTSFYNLAQGVEP